MSSNFSREGPAANDTIWPTESTTRYDYVIMISTRWVLYVSNRVVMISITCTVWYDAFAAKSNIISVQSIAKATTRNVRNTFSDISSDEFLGFYFFNITLREIYLSMSLKLLRTVRAIAFIIRTVICLCLGCTYLL